MPRLWWVRLPLRPGGTGRRSPTSSMSTPGLWTNTAPSSTLSTSPSTSTRKCSRKLLEIITFHYHHLHSYQQYYYSLYNASHIFSFIYFHDLVVNDILSQLCKQYILLDIS